jgi:hypothetical protein
MKRTRDDDTIHHTTQHNNQPFRLLLTFDIDCDATPHDQKNRSSSPFSAFLKPIRDNHDNL